MDESDFVLYDSLLEDESDDLREDCIEDLVTPPPKYCGYRFCVCFDVYIDEDVSICDEDLLKVMDYLRKRSDTVKLFYGNYDEQRVENMCNTIRTNKTARLESFDIYLIAQAFIRFVKLNSIPYYPKNIENALYKSYVNYNSDVQKQIMKRLPFIFNRMTRLFFITLIDLFKVIDEKKAITLTTKKDLLHIFGTIVFKGVFEKKQINGYHRMIILRDLMNVDFERVDKRLFKVKDREN